MTIERKQSSLPPIERPVGVQPRRTWKWTLALTLALTIAPRINALADESAAGTSDSKGTKPAAKETAPAKPVGKTPDQPQPPDSADGDTTRDLKTTPGRSRANEPNNSPTPRKSRSPGGLTGVSRRYDDLDCQVIQQRVTVAIPAAAVMLEVDGDRLLLEAPENLGGTAKLFLPRGVHRIRFRPSESATVVTVTEDFGTEYDEMTKFFQRQPDSRSRELLERGARAMDVHHAPFLLNFLGGWYAGHDQWEAAERCFRRSLSVNPAFAPAHLNLAHCLSRRHDAAGAANELNLADAFNIGNVFGLSSGVSQLRSALGLPLSERQSVTMASRSYMAAEAQSEEDRRIAAILLGLSRYAVRESERAKLVNNLAVHFADSKKPELALFHYRGALALVRQAGPERLELARQILTRMSRTCRDAGFAEAADYEAMIKLVGP